MSKMENGIGKETIKTSTQWPALVAVLRPALVALAALAASAGCGGSDSTLPPSKDIVDFKGKPDATIDGHAFFKSLHVPITVKGTKLLAIMDTGGRHGELPDSVVDAVEGFAEPDVELGGVTFETVASEVFSDGADEIPSKFGRVSGLVGTNMLAAVPVTFDFRAEQLSFGLAALKDVGAPIEVPLTTLAAEPAAGDGPRAIVKVDIEGHSLRLMVDTGSPYILISKKIGDLLKKDGRGTIPAHIEFAAGSLDGTFMRAREVKVGDATVKNLQLIATDDFELLLEQNEQKDIDGIIAMDFLQHFAASFDFSKKSLKLQRYTSGDPFYDDKITFGFTVELLDASGAGTSVDTGLPSFPTTPTVAACRVTAVGKGTVAEKQGVKVGDFLVAVGDHTLAGLDASVAEPLFFGPTDTATREVSFGCPSGSAFSSCKTKARKVTLPFEVDPIHL